MGQGILGVKQFFDWGGKKKVCWGGGGEPSFFFPQMGGGAGVSDWDGRQQKGAG